MKKRNLWIIALVILPTLAGLACRFTAADPTESSQRIEIIEEPTTPPPTDEPAQEPTMPVLAEPTQEQAPERTSPQDIVLLEQRFWTQDEDTVDVYFFFENPNQDFIFEDFSYTIRIFDENENEIDDYSINLPWFFPEDLIMADNRFYLADETITVESTSIEWDFQSVTQTSPFGQTNPLVADQANFWPDDNFSKVTGTIKNTSADTLLQYDVQVICYDINGDFAGAGRDYVEFIPGENQMGFSTFVDTYAEVASVEVLPVLTSWTSAYQGDDFWNDITITEDNYYLGSWGRIIGGVTIQNNAETVLSDTYVQINFYDEANTLISIGTTRIDLLLPGDTVGVSPWIDFPPEGRNFVRYDIIVLPGEHDDDYELTENPFIVNSTVLTNDNSDVLVNFTNSYAKQASDVEVFVLVYDAAGEIIGGGSQWLIDPIPGGATSEVELWVDYDSSREVTNIQAWVLPKWLTDFE
jgi:hypothetical protein